MKPRDGERVPCNYEVYKVGAASHHVMASHDMEPYSAGGVEDVAGPCVKTSRQRHCMKPHVVTKPHDHSEDLRQAARPGIREYGNT